MCSSFQPVSNGRRKQYGESYCACIRRKRSIFSAPVLVVYRVLFTGEEITKK